MDGKIVVITLLIILTACQPPPQTMISAVQDTGTINIFFCPRQPCEESVLNVLQTATTSIHCALYDLRLERIIALLNEKSRSLSVQVVIDDENKQKLPLRPLFPLKADGSYGLMHNKFCIIDQQTVITGSMNPTENDAHKNNNNLMIINSAILAHNYEQEFQEMWNGIFKKGERVQNPVIQLPMTTLKNYFCPDDACAEQVEEELRKAQQSIYFMTFSFTHKGIANVLLLKHLNNVTVQGVMETTQISEHSVYPTLAYQLGTVRKDGNKRNMHHKVFIIDERTVVTGSFNPTAGGNERNDENILIMTNPLIAREFLDEFQLVWKEAEANDQ